MVPALVFEAGLRPKGSVPESNQCEDGALFQFPSWSRNCKVKPCDGNGVRLMVSRRCLSELMRCLNVPLTQLGLAEQTHGLFTLIQFNFGLRPRETRPSLSNTHGVVISLLILYLSSCSLKVRQWSNHHAGESFFFMSR